MDNRKAVHPFFLFFNHLKEVSVRKIDLKYFFPNLEDSFQLVFTLEERYTPEFEKRLIPILKKLKQYDKPIMVVINFSNHNFDDEEFDFTVILEPVHNRYRVYWDRTVHWPT